MEQITHDDLKKIIEGWDFESLIGGAENIFFESSLKKTKLVKKAKKHGKRET
jgi:hypothetical protein